MEHIDKHVEALIFASDKPVHIEEICKTLELKFGQSFDENFIDEVIERLMLKYQNEDFSFCIQKINQGYVFRTKEAYYETISAYTGVKNSKRLSVAALETLAIIAYKQPVTKAEIEKIRGVNADYTVHKLLEKELIIMKGRSDAPGRPVLYATSDFFMEHFGINSTDELPRLKELEVAETTEATALNQNSTEQMN